MATFHLILILLLMLVATLIWVHNTFFSFQVGEIYYDRKQAGTTVMVTCVDSLTVYFERVLEEYEQVDDDTTYCLHVDSFNDKYERG